jgi:tyrosyl-DNA phosphodiesterase-1
MTQAVWQSPLLPLIHNRGLRAPNPSPSPETSDIGSGARFKHDLLAYLRAYGQGKTGRLVRELENYDFGEIRAALVASTPSKQRARGSRNSDVMWGWPSLERVLGCITCGTTPNGDRPRVAVQVSR